jgi:tyrosyl-tRNA synthetase
MHLGNFLLINTLKRLQLAGHRIIALVGGATGIIGDPSGKSKERNLLDFKTVADNSKKLKKQLSRFIDFSTPEKGIVVNNYDWISKINLIDYLRDYGKCFSVNYMLAKDSVASRMENGISYLEFSYSILQAIDFAHLYKTKNCTIQIGGADQWGNLTSGLELIKKTIPDDPKVGVFTIPLLLTADGKKFGKSESGALYLDPALTSSYKIYQYFMNLPDTDAIKCLQIYTYLTLDEIAIIAKDHEAAPHLRLAQKKLAYEMVSLVRGRKEAKNAIHISECLFNERFDELDEKTIEEVFADVLVDLIAPATLLDALVSCKIASSNREARELISASSIKVDGIKVNDVSYMLQSSTALFTKYTIIKKGKKNYYLLRHAY